MSQSNPFQTRLREAGLYVTRDRVRILKVIDAASQPLTVTGIAAQLPRPPHRTTLYRTIQSMVRAGLLKTIRFRADQADRYEPAEAVRQHHHHAVCESCGSLEPVGGCEETNLPVRLPGGFKVLAHQLELYGLCASCQQEAA